MKDLAKHQDMTVKLERYGILLTYHQRQVMEKHFYFDLSLQEIADELEISKSAVSEIVVSSTAKLDELESTLHLIEQERLLSDYCDELEKNADEKIKKIINKIRKLTDHGI